jgi:hypothetical protein
LHLKLEVKTPNLNPAKLQQPEKKQPNPIHPHSPNLPETPQLHAATKLPPPTIPNPKKNRGLTGVDLLHRCECSLATQWANCFQNLTKIRAIYKHSIKNWQHSQNKDNNSDS